MAKRIILEDKLGNQLHPVTLGKYVVTESGETVDGLVSKTQMFSPVVTMDSSMSKVGVGNDIDVHSNVKDGAYEECVFEGRTLVNIASRVGEFSIVSTASNHGQKEIATNTLLKRNTKYLLALDYNVTFDDVSTSKSFYFDAGHGYSYIGTQDNRVITSSNGTGHFVTTFTTKDEEKTINSNIHLTVFKGGDSKAIINNLVIVEYQDGMENWDIPYFTGICDSKMPILHNVGKNLFDVNGNINQKFDNMLGTLKNTLVGNNGFVANNYTMSHHGVGVVLKLKPNTTYTISGKVENEGAVLLHSKIKVNIFIKVYSNSNFTISYTTSTETELCLSFATNGDISTTKARFFDIQIEVSSTATTYESYKTNILPTSDEVVLRSVGNVKDTYNALTGEYVKRIEEIVINGSESGWTLTTSAYQPSNVDYINFDMSVSNIKNPSLLYCDTIPTRVSTIPSVSLDSYSIGGHTTNKLMRLCIEKSKASTVEELKTYLQANPATVQYELATPITTIIKPSTIPFAYANGHVILESGYTGQSLLPTLKYSAVTGRTGQVTQNAKILHQQEKQIASLEDLLLTQIIQMDYERTLLQFDFELNTYGLN